MSNLKALKQGLSTEDLFQRYHVGWVTKNPDLIASLHSDDTTFWIHDGSKAVRGREAVRESCAALFAKYKFTFEEGRTFFGHDHWVFEYAMVLSLSDTAGVPFVAKVEMLDVVTVDKDGLVTGKDVYMNGAQAAAVYTRAGIVRSIET